MILHAMRSGWGEREAARHTDRPRWHPDLGISSSSTVRAKFMLFIGHRSVLFCYSSLNRLRHCIRDKWPLISQNLERGVWGSWALHSER